MLRQHQYSNELRYAITAGNFDITTGAYYYRSTLFGAEQRILAAGGGIITQEGGGEVITKSYALFGSVDWHFMEGFTLNLGGRYNWEAKPAHRSEERRVGKECDRTGSSRRAPDQ